MKISQKDRIINYIREFGSISSWEAYADLGITQLGARIDQLKKRVMSLRQNGKVTLIDMAREQITRDII